MNTGDDMQNRSTAERALHALKPAALDGLARDAHERRRDADLARILRTNLEPAAGEPAGRRPRLPRRPVLLIAGAAAAACAAAGAVVAVGDGPAPAPPAATASRPVDARSFLLASADKAERTPAATGRYWYTEITTASVIDTKTDPGARRPSPGARPGGRGDKRGDKLPYTYELRRGERSWIARDGDDPSRTVTGIDAKAVFPTPEDEAAWKRAGSRALVPPELRRESVNDYDMAIRYSIGDEGLTMAELRKLPDDAAGLEAELRRRFDADARRVEAGTRTADPEVRRFIERTRPSFSEYVFAVAADLLAGPLTPGTKAALYRVLAARPDVRSPGTATDPLGRRGVALVLPFTGEGPAVESRLIVDRESAELLAYDSGRLTMSYGRTGWVDRIGARP